MYYEKIEAFLDSISKSNDAEYVDITQDLIESAAEYMKRVSILEVARSAARYNMEGDKYREYIQQLDGNRSVAHNKLIANVRLTNRLCRLNGIPDVFEGDENNRIEIADFAQQIVDEYFDNRKL